MPELPEVETMVRGIRPFVAGRTIVTLRRCRCACKPIDLAPGLRTMSRRVVGRTVTDVRRLAKRVVLDLSSGEALAIEPRMTGLMLLADPPDRTHLRLRWDFDGNGRESAGVKPDAGPEAGLPPAISTPHSLWFWDRRGLGTVRLYAAGEIEDRLGLGPDALEMTVDDWRERLARTDRPIKVALLDQRLVAGIGNLYASEILHTAGIAPTSSARSLTAPAITRLHCAVRNVLEDAIRHEGSTLGDATYRNALNQQGSYQNHHRVYGRAGEPCATCRRGVVERIVQAQRSTFFCPRCQRERNGRMKADG